MQPTISQDLQPLNVFVGSSVGLTVGAQGGNLSYFWYKNNTLVPSQTTATFSFPAIALTMPATTALRSAIRSAPPPVPPWP